jgi:Glyoxalase-like domain
MAYAFQVVVDCSAPHPLADWWAETLGWEREPTDEAFIRRMVEAGHARESETMRHDGALVWAAGAAINHPDGGAPRVLFQRVPEPKTVKNRLHLDVRVGEQDRDDVVTRLVDRGATVLHTGQQGPFSWVTMTDPEGNEFCVA